MAPEGSAALRPIVIGQDSGRADAVAAPNQNIENNPMQSSMGSLPWML
jgi:hypothetical protein